MAFMNTLIYSLKLIIDYINMNFDVNIARKFNTEIQIISLASLVRLPVIIGTVTFVQLPSLVKSINNSCKQTP